MVRDYLVSAAVCNPCRSLPLLALGRNPLVSPKSRSLLSAAAVVVVAPQAGALKAQAVAQPEEHLSSSSTPLQSLLKL
jgi:hypothetical protein